MEREDSDRFINAYDGDTRVMVMISGKYISRYTSRFGLWSWEEIQFKKNINEKHFNCTFSVSPCLSSDDVMS